MQRIHGAESTQDKIAAAPTLLPLLRKFPTRGVREDFRREQGTTSADQGSVLLNQANVRQEAPHALRSGSTGRTESNVERQTRSIGEDLPEGAGVRSWLQSTSKRLTLSPISRASRNYQLSHPRGVRRSRSDRPSGDDIRPTKGGLDGHQGQRDRQWHLSALDLRAGNRAARRAVALRALAVDYDRRIRAALALTATRAWSVRLSTTMTEGRLL